MLVPISNLLQVILLQVQLGVVLANRVEEFQDLLDRHTNRVSFTLPIIFAVILIRGKEVESNIWPLLEDLLSVSVDHVLVTAGLLED